MGAVGFAQKIHGISTQEKKIPWHLAIDI